MSGHLLYRMLFAAFLVAYVCAFEFLQDLKLDGFDECVRLMDTFDENTAWYNCSGRLVGYSDYAAPNQVTENVLGPPIEITQDFHLPYAYVGDITLLNRTDSGIEHRVVKNGRVSGTLCNRWWNRVQAKYRDWSKDSLEVSCGSSTEKIPGGVHWKVSGCNDEQCDPQGQITAGFDMVSKEIGRWGGGSWCMNFTCGGNCQVFAYRDDIEFAEADCFIQGRAYFPAEDENSEDENLVNERESSEQLMQNSTQEDIAYLQHEIRPFVPSYAPNHTEPMLYFT